MSTFYSRKQENFLNPLCSSMSKNSSKEKVDWRYNERWESSGTLTHAYWKGVAVVWGEYIPCDFSPSSQQSCELSARGG